MLVTIPKTLRVVVNLSEELEQSVSQHEAEKLRLELLLSLSEAMPEWFYIYESGKETTAPMILTNGKAELFVTQK